MFYNVNAGFTVENIILIWQCAHGSDQHIGPFPVRVAKLLSPYTLRNVEYDVWMENKGKFYLLYLTSNVWMLLTYAVVNVTDNLP